jgi:CheY-like chemotaxis protein
VRLPRVPMLSRAERSPIELRGDDPLRGSTVLIVDDDVRNVFALTSALEMHGMSVLYADNGREGIDLLREHGGAVDLVLMDVMMPDMDGNETTTQIRSTPGFDALPILFLTAKAMPGDREKSLQSGASDYITKPVDLDRLLTVMRSWLVPVRSGTPDGASA